MAFTFITNDYFRGDLNLPNIGEGSIDGGTLTQKIDYYQRRYFEALLGIDLATAYLAEMDAYNSADPDNTYQGWLDLTFGSTYVGDDTMVYRWQGFTTHDSPNVNDSDEFKSPLANFVYCKHLMQISSVTTSLGVKEANAENMASQTPIYKIVDAWNKMCEWHWHMHNFVMTNIHDYENYIGEKYPPSLTLTSNITENRDLFMPINSFGI